MNFVVGCNSVNILGSLSRSFVNRLCHHTHTMLSVGCLIVTVVVLLWSYYKLRRRHLEKHAAKIPGGPALPIIGNLREFQDCKTTTDLFYNIIAMTEPFSEGLRTFWLGPIFFIGVWKPEFLEVILNSPFAASKSTIMYNFVLRDLSMSGVFVTNGTTWKKLRKPINKTMRIKFFEEYHKTFVKRTGNYVNYIKKNINKGEFDVIESMGGVLLDMFAETHLGVDINELEENKYDFHLTFAKFTRLAAEKVLNYYVILEPFYYFTRASKELRGSIEKIKTFVYWLITERMQRIAGSDEGFEFTDFIIKKNNNRTKSEMFKELVDFIGAGTDTSTSVISSVLLFLAMFPEVQQKAYEEQAMIFGDSTRDPSPTDLSSMVYLTRVIKETLRIVSPPGIFRELSGDIVVGDYTLPKGASVFIILQKAHRSPHDWDNPEGFDPDHFLPDKVASRHRYAYLPFSYGARGCPGYQYAFSSMKVLISGILRNFKLTTSLKFEEIKYNYGIMLEINSGYKIKFEERKK